MRIATVSRPAVTTSEMTSRWAHQRQRSRHKRANELLGQHGMVACVAMDVFRLGDMHD
jgi:hypothetical protein